MKIMPSRFDLVNGSAERTERIKQLKVFPRSVYRDAYARVHHFEFIQRTWQRPDGYLEAKENPFQKEICDRIDLAIKNYKKGLEEFKATADENFKKVEAFFSSK